MTDIMLYFSLQPSVSATSYNTKSTARKLEISTSSN